MIGQFHQDDLANHDSSRCPPHGARSWSNLYLSISQCHLFAPPSHDNADLLFCDLHLPRLRTRGSLSPYITGQLSPTRTSAQKKHTLLYVLYHCDVLHLHPPSHQFLYASREFESPDITRQHSPTSYSSDVERSHEKGTLLLHFASDPDQIYSGRQPSIHLPPPLHLSPQSQEKQSSFDNPHYVIPQVPHSHTTTVSSRPTAIPSVTSADASTCLHVRFMYYPSVFSLRSSAASAAPNAESPSVTR